MKKSYLAYRPSPRVFKIIYLLSKMDKELLSKDFLTKLFELISANYSRKSFHRLRAYPSITLTPLSY